MSAVLATRAVTMTGLRMRPRHFPQLPKRGFFSLHRVSYQIVNVGVLSGF